MGSKNLGALDYLQIILGKRTFKTRPQRFFFFYSVPEAAPRT